MTEYDYDLIWLNMVECDWTWLNMTEYDRIVIWLNMTEQDWIWMNMNEYDSPLTPIYLQTNLRVAHSTLP